MVATHRLRTKTYVLLILTVGLSSVGEVLLGKGMKQLGEVKFNSVSSLTGAFARTFTDGTIWLGIACLLLYFVGYLLLLSWADYSYVSPASAFGYALVPLMGFALLGEVVTSTRWAGIALICMGVGLVGRTPPNTTGTK